MPNQNWCATINCFDVDRDSPVFSKYWHIGDTKWRRIRLIIHVEALIFTHELWPHSESHQLELFTMPRGEGSNFPYNWPSDQEWSRLAIPFVWRWCLECTTLSNTPNLDVVISQICYLATLHNLKEILWAWWARDRANWETDWICYTSILKVEWSPIQRWCESRAGNTRHTWIRESRTHAATMRFTEWGI